MLDVHAKVLASAALILSCLALVGCQTADRAYEGTAGVVNPDSTRLQGGVKWLSPPSQMGLRQTPSSDMTVYLRVKNSSGSAVAGLFNSIAEQLRQAGYEVTRNIDDAQYTLLADTRYYGENRKKDGGGAILTGAGLGGITGAVIGHNVGDGNRNVGAAAGAAMGAIAGNIMANRNKMVEIDIVVDIRVGERVEGGVQTETTTDTGAGVSHRDRSGSETGSGTSGTSQVQKLTRDDDFLYHSNRVVAHAKRMNLTPDQALPYLEERVSAAIGSVLP